jgi:hypothetical protein
MMEDQKYWVDFWTKMGEDGRVPMLHFEISGQPVDFPLKKWLQEKGII